jgi:hypothetical protein
LVEKQDFNTALRVLVEGLRYNPVDTGLLFEMGEICKLRKDWEVYRKISELCFEYAHTSIALARLPQLRLHADRNEGLGRGHLLLSHGPAL